MPAISIITPVFNSTDTLMQCVKSIIGQSFDNWELILVDDGSTDGSTDLCQQLAAKDSRIKALQQTHKGVSTARNLALDHISSEYVCFIDADDAVEPDYLEKLYEHNAYDMVICGYYVESYSSSGHIIKQEQHLPDTLSIDLTSFRSKLEPLFMAGMININCNKLLHTHIIQENRLRYEDVSVEEDYLFMLEYLKHCHSLTTVCKPLYHWKHQEGKKSGVSSCPEDIVEVYNKAHLLTADFFNDPNTAAKIMYPSYYFLALKYYDDISDRHKRNLRLNLLMGNSLVKKSFHSHKPVSAGESAMMTLLKLRCYSLFLFFHKRLKQ